jgi:hypothetical protein
MRNPFEQHYVELSRTTIEHIVAQIAQHGIVTFDGIADEAAAIVLAESIGPVYAHRDSAANGVTRIVAADAPTTPGFRGFTHFGLPVHTDRSVAETPPTCLLFWCETPAEHGGETLLADGRAVYEQLTLRDRAVVTALTRPRSAMFASGDGLYCGAIYERVSPRRIAVRFRNDDLLYVSTTVVDALAALRTTLEAATQSCRLERGQGYLIQNARWLHGRLPFRGARRCGRLLINAAANDEQLRGFLDPCAA